jgi:hypothetical protein
LVAKRADKKAFCGCAPFLSPVEESGQRHAVLRGDPVKSFFCRIGDFFR